MSIKMRWLIKPLHTGGLFHCYTLDESIPRLRSVGSILLLYSIFDVKSCFQTMQSLIRHHDVASDLDLHFLPMTLLPVSRSEWVRDLCCLQI